MPGCRECEWREGETCRAYQKAQVELQRPLPPPPTGACTVAIVESYLPLIHSGMKILEIGCGSWSRIRDYCMEVGAVYEGLDVQAEYYGAQCVATRIGNLAELSCPDSSFDLVIGNQTMEHWAEHGCTLMWGLYQCFRVTKPGGSVLINVPIHFHGTKEFVHGRLGRLKTLFSQFSDSVVMEHWGAPTDPIPPYYPHPDFSALNGKPAYVLDIRATRDRELPDGVRNTLGFHGRLARLIHYSLSFNFYLFKKRMLGYVLGI